MQTLLLVRADFEGFQCARTITLLANQRGDLYCAVSCWKVAARRAAAPPRPPPDSFPPLHKAPPSTPRRRHQSRSLTRAFCRLDSRHTKVAGSSSSDSIVAVLFTITGLSEQGVPRGPMVPPDFERSINPILTRGGRLCPT